MVARKRNLEGTANSQNMFTHLSQSSLHSISEKMGIKMNSSSSNSFDILRELEIVRANLYGKQQQLDSTVIIEEIDEETEDSMLQLEWIQEETSEPDESSFAQSRKKGKELGKPIELPP